MIPHHIYDQLAIMGLLTQPMRYYANAVLKSQVFQFSRRTDEDRHLHLVCFTAHQFYRLQEGTPCVDMTSDVKR